ncbi:MAG: pyridoxamine 5'-phosphate oxidase family protein [Actinobacteria bacterium]|nr:pyridoxamine 5'-phosphate oxidase family protein [Actinomycetota bacterium]
MSNELPAPGSTERTRVRRLADKTVVDRNVLNAILDAGLVAHVAVVTDGQPYVVSVAYARDGDRVLFHGSTASRLFRGLATGDSTCLTVTLIDGLVLARSAFESSINYRSVMVLGSCVVLKGEEKDRALRVISDHLLPDRWDDIRPPTKKETAATLVLALSLEECSVKVGEGGPEEAEGDETWPAWGGHVPIREVLGEPVSDEFVTDQPVPDYVRKWTR